MKIIKIESERLIITTCSFNEMRDLKSRQKDPEMAKAYGEMIDTMKKNPGCEEWGCAWKISLKDGTRVGDLCFKGIPDENGSVEIGYGIDEEYQHNGYATEAVGAMVNWCYETDGVYSLCGQTEADNIYSQKVLEKNGFEPDGFGEEGPMFRIKFR